MSKPKKSTKTEIPMSAMDAIYHRCAVRDYASVPINQAVVRSLLDADGPTEPGNSFCAVSVRATVECFG